MEDLKIRQKCEEMIAYGYVALRQFPKFERHVLAAEIREAMWRALRKDSIHRMKRKMRRMARLYHRGLMSWDEIDPVIMSWIGHAKHADTYNLRGKVLGGVGFVPPPIAIPPKRRGGARSLAQLSQRCAQP